MVTDRIPQSHADGLRLLSDARLSSAERTRDFGAQLRDSVGPIAFTGEFSDRRTSDYQTARVAKLANSATATRNASVGASYVLNNGFIGIGVNRFQSVYGIPSPDAVSIDMKRRPGLVKRCNQSRSVHER